MFINAYNVHNGKRKTKDCRSADAAEADIGEDMTKEMVPYEVLIRDALAGETPKERYENLVLMKTILRQAEKRIAELEAENNRLAELLHNELSSVEIATDLGNKRWVALNDIYENGEKHNTNWCKRKAQEGLGIKNA